MGKSTLVDVLRLIALEANYPLSRELETAPKRIFGENLQGFRPGQDRVPFSVANVHHEYEETDTYAIAQFDGGVEIRLVFFAPPPMSASCLFGWRRSVELESIGPSDLAGSQRARGGFNP